MDRITELNIQDEEELCNVAKALSSPARIEMLKLLSNYSYNVAEIADRLGIAASSTAFHINILENAGLVNTEVQPGTRGSIKICSRKRDIINIRLNELVTNINEMKSISMPIGCYTDCEVHPTCGIADSDGNPIGYNDSQSNFYLPEHTHANILWTSSGYVEYKFPTPEIKHKIIQRLSISMEICSEAPNFREDWKSDITLWINDRECGTFHSPGDFGSRRGRLNPAYWPNGSTQYGLLTTWEVGADGASINGNKVAGSSLELLRLLDKPYIKVKIGNKKDAQHIGGFNIFGSKFGDYPQDIILSLEY